MGQYYAKELRQSNVPTADIGSVPYLPINQPMRLPSLSYIGYGQMNYTFTQPTPGNWEAALEKGYIEIHSPEITTHPPPTPIPESGKIIYNSPQHASSHRMEITKSSKTGKMMNENIALQLSTMMTAVANGTIFLKSDGYVKYNDPVSRFLSAGAGKGMRFGETDFFEVVTIDSADREFRWLHGRIVVSQGRLLAAGGKPYGIEYRLFTVVS
ncbi:hypothetical protein BZA77DRAFT_355214 [Pyronema omphalodes]|nr:hypothetical protein BZA77DRAFT_355214 [Pyronema omphalodes]